MQLTLPYPRGQQRPWNSIPRINWSHPLAAGLACYAYDAGGGFVFDLVNGGRGTILSSTTHAAVTASPFGSAWKYPLTSSSDGLSLPLRTKVTNLTTAAPFTFASGTLTLTAPVAGAIAAGTLIAGQNIGFAFGPAATTTTWTIYLDQGTTQLITGAATNSLNTYNTVVCVCPTNTTSKIYCNGKLDRSDSAITTNFANASQQVTFNSIDPTAAITTGGANYVYYLAGWSRALSAGEASQLHSDPYCFLIYPEDELFALMVGASAAAFVPYNPWPQAAPILAT